MSDNGTYEEKVVTFICLACQCCWTGPAVEGGPEPCPSCNSDQVATT